VDDEEEDKDDDEDLLKNGFGAFGMGWGVGFGGVGRRGVLKVEEMGGVLVLVYQLTV
jgi:hypothetical protein